MGISFLGRSCWSYGDCYGANNEPTPRAPDPVNFRIIDTKQVDSHVVAKIRYPDCTNYEGIKILVYLNTTERQVRNQRRLDPHFSNDKQTLSPFARFEPTEEGWTMAVELAMNI